MFVLKILIVFALILLVAVILNGVEDYRAKSSLVKLSFSDTLSKLELPIVSLTNNNQSFNFLVDTGANYSVIDELVLDKLSYVSTEEAGSVYGVDGAVIPIVYVDIELCHGDVKFTDSFQAIRVHAFDNIKNTYGIEIAGILGSSFLKRYNFTIDFKDLIVYTKRKSVKNDLRSNNPDTTTK